MSSRSRRIPKAVLIEIRERARCGEYYRCEECGRGVTEVEALSPHHILHRSQGGLDTAENLQMICNICHLRKHN